MNNMEVQLILQLGEVFLEFETITLNTAKYGGCFPSLDSVREALDRGGNHKWKCTLDSRKSSIKPSMSRSATLKTRAMLRLSVVEMV